MDEAEDGEDNSQDASKTVNVIFGGIPGTASKRSNKLVLREIMSIEPAAPKPLKWSEVPITFTKQDQWTNFSEPGRFPLVLDTTHDDLTRRTGTKDEGHTISTGRGFDKTRQHQHTLSFMFSRPVKAVPLEL